MKLVVAIFAEPQKPILHIGSLARGLSTSKSGIILKRLSSCVILKKGTLLIDAQQEPEEDLAFFQQMYERISQPVDYWTIPNTGHYLDTGLVLKSSAYHQPTVKAFVDKIDQWLKQSNSELLKSQSLTNKSI